MQIQIVQPAARDAAIIVNLLIRQFEEHRLPAETSPLAAATESMLADQRLGFFLLAKVEGQTVGLAAVSLCWTLEHGGRSAWLDELYVLPDFRSQGIGSALVEAVLSQAAAMGCAAVDLEVDMDHRRAERLYRRFGFEPLPRARWVKELR